MQSEVSQKQNKTPIQHINAYIWNRVRWEWWPYIWDSKRDTDMKNRLLDSGRRWGWDDLREQHWNMCIAICEIDDQSKFNAWNRALKASALGQPRGMGWGGKREGVSGWGTHVHLWLIHVNVWQNPPQYYKVISLQLKETDFFFKEQEEFSGSEINGDFLLRISGAHPSRISYALSTICRGLLPSCSSRD